MFSDLRLPLVPLPSPRNLRTEDFYKEQREKEVGDSEKQEWDGPMGKRGKGERYLLERHTSYVRLYRPIDSDRVFE